MKSLAIILSAALVVYQVDALEEERDINIDVQQDDTPEIPEWIPRLPLNHSIRTNDEKHFGAPDLRHYKSKEAISKLITLLLDKNECRTFKKLCGIDEICVNNIGSFSCNCRQGSTRVGGICEECVSPSLYLEDLGCISLVEKENSWDDANTHCQQEGKRLLEEIQLKHMEPLSEYFDPILPDGRSYNVWIGLQNSQWATSGDNVADDLWRNGEPDEGNEVCGAISLRLKYLGLKDDDCSETLYAFCQSLPY